MKLLISFATVGLASLLQASIATWVTGSPSSLTSTYVGGTAYLLEVAATGPSLEQMKSWISTNGLTGENADVTVLDSNSIYGIDGYYLSDQKQLTGVVENMSSTYYVLFVDSEGVNFVFSNGVTIENSNWYKVEVPSGTSYTASFTEGFDEGQDSWASNAGIVGGGETPDPDVPEPTALALLALGVAGVTLRRKVCA